MGELRIGEALISDMSDGDLIAWMDTHTERRLRDSTAALWLAIMRALDQDGIPATVRHLFYVAAGLGLVHKSDAGYQTVDYHLRVMRRCEAIPYSFLADHNRRRRKPQTWGDLGTYFEHGRLAYRRALWDTQRDYVEIWCEKDAIAGVLYDVTGEWDVSLMTVRGYTSDTFAFESAEAIKEQGKPTYIYYFGDWDPSGAHIAQDLERKLREFGAVFDFERVAIQPWQIAAWGLPTRPAKGKGPRAKGWAGPCVEIDALSSKRLRALCQEVIERHIDAKALADVRQTEQLERAALADVAQSWAAR